MFPSVWAPVSPSCPVASQGPLLQLFASFTPTTENKTRKPPAIRTPKRDEGVRTSVPARESSSEKETDAKFPVPKCVRPRAELPQTPDRGDAAAASTHLGEAASTPGWEAARPAPRGGRAPRLRHASFPARGWSEALGSGERRQMVASGVHAGEPWAAYSVISMASRKKGGKSTTCPLLFQIKKKKKGEKNIYNPSLGGRLGR